VNSEGIILLKTDGIPDWDYKQLLGYYRSWYKKKHYYLVTSPHFVLARVNQKWSFYDNTIKWVKDLEELCDYQVDGKSCGDYVVISVFEPGGQPYNGGNILRSMVLYKDGTTIYTSEGKYLEYVRQYEKDNDFCFVTNSGFYQSGSLPVFKGSKYLFNVLSSTSYSLFDDKDELAVFYDSKSTSKKYGVTNKQLEIVIPAILDYAAIAFGSFVIYRLNGQCGVWDKSLNNVIPQIFNNISVQEHFFIVSEAGRFPSPFWTKWLQYFQGNSISYSNDNGSPSGCRIYKTNGDLSWNDVFDDVYCHFEHCRYQDGVDYDATIGLCIVSKKNKAFFGVISKDGDFIVPPKYDYLEIVQEVEEEKKHNPKVIVFANNLKIQWETDASGSERCVRKGGEYGIMSINGDVLIPALYDSVKVFGNYVRVRKNNKYGLYSIDGSLLLDTMYSAIAFIGIEGKTAMAVYTVDGKVEAPVSYLDESYAFGLKDFYSSKPARDYISFHEEEIAVSDGKWGYINCETKKRGEALFTEVHPFDNGKAIVKYNDSYYLIDVNLKFISGPQESISCGKYHSNNFNPWGNFYDGDSDSGYTSQDLEDMYRDAFDGNPDAQWNID
jgi:hypothetical protein